MQLDACGCLWDWEGDTLNISPCESDRGLVERAMRIAWKIAARRKMSFREAWQYLWLRVVARWIADVMKTAP